MDYRIFGNTGKDYLIILGIFLGTLVVLKIFREIILHRLQKAAEKTKTDLDDAFIQIIHGIRPPFYFIVSLYFALKFLRVPPLAVQIIDGLFILALTFQAVRAIHFFIDYWIRKAAPGGAVRSISSFAKIFIWILALLIILSNWGINVTSLIAGLGIGGIAVAFALQNILGDIFSSFSILIDKPFQVGDFIVVGDDMGTVEKIGIKSTRIRTLQGEELVISNRELTDARVHNYKKMEKRRITFSFGVLYETPNEKLEKIPRIVKGIIEKEPLAEIDRVHFKSFGDSSLDFEVVYYILTPDYNDYMNTQQSINLGLKQEFEKEGIEFAYPTRVVFLKK